MARLSGLQRGVYLIVAQPANQCPDTLGGCAIELDKRSIDGHAAPPWDSGCWSAFTDSRGLSGVTTTARSVNLSATAESPGRYGLLQISRAKRIARPTSNILDEGKDAINDPIFLFETVCKWSQLTTQSWGMPSAFERNTSDGISRIVVVMGAMVTSPRYSSAEFRVRMRTGRFLSGGTNLYQRISPCFIHHPTPAQFPKLQTHRQPPDGAYTLDDA